MTSSADESSIRLAESLIEGVLSEKVLEQEQAVDRALADFASARKQLTAAQRDLRTWRTRREIEHVTGIKVLDAARLADIVPSKVPPGRHQEAVTEYLKEHPPVWLPPRNSRALKVVRRGARAAARAIRGIPPTIHQAGRRR